MPIGFFLALLGMKFKGIIFYTITLSLLIETAQYIFNRGLCETDDVIHNAIGGLIGLCLFRTLKFSFFLKS